MLKCKKVYKKVIFKAMFSLFFGIDRKFIGMAFWKVVYNKMLLIINQISSQHNNVVV